MGPTYDIVKIVMPSSGFGSHRVADHLSALISVGIAAMMLSKTHDAGKQRKGKGHG